MKQEQTGLNTTRYTYTLGDERHFIAHFKDMQERNTGTVTEVFINNGLAFEYTPNRVIDTDQAPDPEAVCIDCPGENCPTCHDHDQAPAPEFILEPNRCPVCGVLTPTTPAPAQVLPGDGIADGGQPYTDEELDIINAPSAQGMPELDNNQNIIL